MKIFFSVIVPAFSRPDELSELLASLEAQQNKNFEVIIADGSLDDSVKKVVDRNKNISVLYLHKKGLGISDARNWGVSTAKGDYAVFFDSDCVIPPAYFEVVEKFLQENDTDAWGGPDMAHESFNPRQKAISYAMTSFFTTGGIRGRKTHAGKFHPRTFNMGIRRSLFNELGGFSGLRVSEDIDLSMRLFRQGKRVVLIEKAYVYHKRRSTFYKFFRQVFSFGSGRVDLQIRHGNALKWVHVIPSLFVAGLLSGLVFAFHSQYLFFLWMSFLLSYSVLIFTDAAVQNRSIKIGILSLYASFIMLCGYGLGMIKAFIARYVFRSGRESNKPEVTRES